MFGRRAFDGAAIIDETLYQIGFHQAINGSVRSHAWSSRLSITLRFLHIFQTNFTRSPSTNQILSLTQRLTNAVRQSYEARILNIVEIFFITNYLLLVSCQTVSAALR